MEEIINYRDLTRAQQRHLPAQLAAVNFYPARGGYTTMRREMARSQPGQLPQFLLVYRNGGLVGYLFLLAEQEKCFKAFPWWAVSNADELPLSTALALLEQGEALCHACGADKLAQQMQAQAAQYRQNK